MLWTAIGYSIDIESESSIIEKPFVKTFYGSHDGQKAIKEASSLFHRPTDGIYVTIVSVVAGSHETSTYIKLQK
jgi:hypothetical protein